MSWSAKVVSECRHPTLTFVIPAHNEADNIERCISSIAVHAPERLVREVIVVDDGSDDETASIARLAGAKVIESGTETIGGSRNEGVAASSGELLIFLDADCALTREWGLEIAGVLETMETIPLCCAGAQVSPPTGGDVFLWKYWFLPFVAQLTASHVGSAHMICTREGFNSVGGFNEALETGEDYELCARITKAGGELLNVPSLRVEHYGFPRTWGEFLKRERWHGRTDIVSLTSFRSSKVALLSTLFVALIFGGLCGMFAGFVREGLVALGAAALLVVGTSTVKFGHAGLRVQTMTLAIIPVYFVGRALAVAEGLGRRLRRGDGRPAR